MLVSEALVDRIRNSPKREQCLVGHDFKLAR
jgi:hypothetical protein